MRAKRRSGRRHSPRGVATTRFNQKRLLKREVLLRRFDPLHGLVPFVLQEETIGIAVDDQHCPRRIPFRAFPLESMKDLVAAVIRNVLGSTAPTPNRKLESLLDVHEAALLQLQKMIRQVALVIAVRDCK